MRRSQGAVIGAVMEVLTDVGEGEAVRAADLEGLVADGAPLSLKDVGNALRYLTRVVGVTKKTGRGEWEVVALAAIERARNFAAWFEDADLESTWIAQTRKANAGKYPTCPSCAMTLGLSQDPETCPNCT